MNHAQLRKFVGLIAVAGLISISTSIPAFGAPLPRWKSFEAVSVPASPTLVSVVSEGLGALVTWSPEPSFYKVQSYKISASIASGFSGTVPTGCASPKPQLFPSANTAGFMTHLCVGVPYTLLVQASNSSGTSSDSNLSDPVVPLAAQVPSIPLISAVYPRAGAVVVHWVPPSIDGGKPLTGYVLSVSGSPSPSKTSLKFPSSVTSANVVGLTNGHTYRLALVAVSSIGASISSTSMGQPAKLVVPEVPQSLRVVPNGKGDLVVSWTSPIDQGNFPISGYRLSYQQETSDGTTWTPSGKLHSIEVSGSATTRILSGLTGFFEVTLSALSKAGTGTAISTSSPVTPSIVARAGTIALSQSTMNALTSFSGGSLAWSTPAPRQVTKLKKGQILIGPASPSTPSGLLVTVLSVSTGASTLTVTTGPASLSQAFRDLTFSASGSPLASPGSGFMPLVAGISGVSQRPHLSVSLSRSFGFNLGAGPVKVSGSTSISANLNLSASVLTGFLHIPNGVSLTASATVSANASMQASISGKSTWKIGQITGAPIDIQLGPFPIVILPTIPIFLGVSGSISVGASASIVVGASLSWSSKSPGSLVTKNLTRAPGIGGGPLVGAAATATASIFLMVQPQLEIYGIGGPNIQATASLTANLNFFARPYFTLVPAISIQVGLDVNFLSIHKSLELTLATLNYPGFSTSSPPNVNLTVAPQNATISPGSALQMTATRSDGRSFQVTWSLQGATSSEQISSNGVVTVGYPAARSFAVYARDKAGAVGETMVSVILPSAPSQPTNVGVSGIGQTSATISWGTPSNQGGSTVDQYRVTNAGSGCSTNGHSCSIGGLSANTAYSACVQAHNVAGWGPTACVGFSTQISNPQPADIYNNYGGGASGIPMCRGNPGFPNSMPGGVVSQSMTVPSGVFFVNQVMIQIDPAPSQVFADLQIIDNGNVIYESTQGTTGDTVWSFGAIGVSPGDQLTIQVSFTANFGQIITVYQVGNPGGTLTVNNSCPNDNTSFSTSSSGLRAVVSGLT